MEDLDEAVRSLREDLDNALKRFSASMEEFARTYVSRVAAQLDQLSAETRGPVSHTLACPESFPHDRHAWRLPDSAVARVCPGVRRTTAESVHPQMSCPDDGPHAAHTWPADHLLKNESVPVACPGVPQGRKDWQTVDAVALIHSLTLAPPEQVP